MEARQNLIELCEKISDGHYKITPECAEYKVFEKWMTDEQISILMAIKGVLQINFLANIAKRAGIGKEKARELLHELTEIGLLEKCANYVKEATRYISLWLLRVQVRIR